MSKKEIFSILFSLYRSLSFRTKRKVFFTFLIMLITSSSECFTVLAVIPLISKITGITNPATNITFGENQLNLQNNFLPIPIFIGFVIISGTLRILDLYNCADLSSSAAHDVSKKTFKTYLSRPYEFHVYGDSSKAIATLTTYVRDTNDYIYNYLRLLSSIFILISLCGTLFFINFRITLFSFLLISFIYITLGSFSKKKLINLSELQVESASFQTKLVQESLLSIREIKIWSAFELFFQNYKKYDWRLRTTERKRLFLGPFPRFLIETLGLIIFVLIFVFAKIFDIENLNIISILGTFALGVQRLLPTINLLYYSWTYINSFKKSVKSILIFLNDNNFQNEELNINKQYILQSNIKFKNVSFKYPKGKKPIFNNVNFNFNKGEIIGISGKSGEGKSTLIDLISGLLIPNNGKIIIDNNLLNEEKKNDFALSWRTSLGYVSQNIFFIRGTFVDNIAFGLQNKNVDLDRVKYVSKLALIDEHIKTYKKSYFDTVYEGGKNLSGGQKQRLGIARALYHSKNLLIFDEATNALDPETEEKIFKNIFSHKKELTVLMISHNPNVLKYCTKLIKICNGEISEI